MKRKYRKTPLPELEKSDHKQNGDTSAESRPGKGRRIPRPQHLGGTIKRLLAYITGKYRAIFVLVLVCILLSACAGVAGSLFWKTLIDRFIQPLLLSADPVFSGLLRAIFFMACVYLVGIVAALVYNLLMVTISQGVLKTIRDDMFRHMQSLPIGYFDTHSHGDVMSHYTNDTDTLRQLISQSIPQLFSSAITIGAVLVAMLMTSFWLTLVVLLGIFCMLKVTANLGGKSGEFFVKQQSSLARVNGYIEEMVHGQKVVKVFCHEEAAKKGFDELNEVLRHNATEANKFANILMPIMSNIGNLLYVLIAVAGGALAIGGVGGLTLGGITAFLQLTRTLTMPVAQVAQQFNSVIMALAGAERIFKLMDEEPESDEGYVSLINVEVENGTFRETEKRTGHWAWKHPHSDGTVTYTPLTGDVRLFEVDFAYVEDKPVLHDISLYAEPGQKVAFVGATGAGKTTITNLINRFYDIADGKIRYDGININKIKKSDLRHSLGMVLQDVSLFTGTVMENIRYGRLEASDGEVIAAAKLANAHDFITRLPKGYDTELTGDGANLSQGQRQLISIARCAVADPPVMILDEATSSIDTRTESLVQQGMDQLMQGRTVFVIAHRLSTVKNADVIMVLDHGRIIERGAHRQLIQENGTYYRLYTGAFELE